MLLAALLVTNTGDNGGIDPAPFAGTGTLRQAIVDANATPGAGTAAGAGNTIAFNARDGVRIEDNSIGNAILSNTIYQNGGLGIDLVPPVGPGPGPSQLQAAPVLTSVVPGTMSTTIAGTLRSRPNIAYTIQYFASGGSGPSSATTLLGQTTVTTGANGSGSVSATVPASLTGGQVVTATATDPAGNTSGFSNALAVTATTVQFSAATYGVTSGTGSATITVVRNGLATGTATVTYTTADGTARAGLDYQPVYGTLTFGPGVTVQTFSVPILYNPQAPASATVQLLLSNPAGGTLGPIAQATLTIGTFAPPHVRAVRAITGPAGVSAIVLTFDEPLDLARAVDLRNYGYSVRIPGRNHILDTPSDILIGLRAATYDPARQAVTLTTTTPIAAGTPILVAVNQATDVPSAAVGVANTQGVLLDGNNDGRPGGAFVAVINSGPRPVPPTGLHPRSLPHPRASAAVRLRR